MQSEEADLDSRKGAWTAQVRRQALGGPRRHRALEGMGLSWARAQEDETLQQLVKQHGTKNWTIIAAGIKGRSGKSCRLR